MGEGDVVGEVLAGEGDGEGGDVDSEGLAGRREEGGYQKGDAACSCAEVEDFEGGGRKREEGGEVGYYGFGFWSWDENTWFAEDIKGAEGLVAEDVL